MTRTGFVKHKNHWWEISFLFRNRKSDWSPQGMVPHPGWSDSNVAVEKPNGWKATQTRGNNWLNCSCVCSFSQHVRQCGKLTMKNKEHCMQGSWGDDTWGYSLGQCRGPIWILFWQLCPNRHNIDTQTYCANEWWSRSGGRGVENSVCNWPCHPPNSMSVP